MASNSLFTGVTINFLRLSTASATSISTARKATGFILNEDWECGIFLVAIYLKYFVVIAVQIPGDNALKAFYVITVYTILIIP